MDTNDGKIGSINYVIGGEETFEEVRMALMETCISIAKRYNLYDSYGDPRYAAIISVLSQENCPSCMLRKLTKSRARKIDAFYGECHSLATNILVEELYDIFEAMGFEVAIATESRLRLGRADIFLEVSRTGISIRDRESKRLVIEIKTGNSFSLAQILRYLCDGKVKKVIVWRIRNRQIISFDYDGTLSLMRKFMRSICLRGRRLLAYEGDPYDCNHDEEPEHFPTDDALEEMFQDFIESIDATLPAIVKAVFESMIPEEAHSAA
ncbi:MAG: hypothetical protein QW279_00750 [Candidatus Jordarchaeaceae archaeon]